MSISTEDTNSLLPIVTPEKARRNDIEATIEFQKFTSASFEDDYLGEEEEDDDDDTAEVDEICNLCSKWVMKKEVFYACTVCRNNFCHACNNDGRIVNPLHCPGCGEHACDDCAPICADCGGGHECHHCFHDAHECSF